MEVMTVGRSYGRRWIEWFSVLIASIFIRDYYLQYTNFLSLSDKESVILSPVYSDFTLTKKREVKTASVLIRLRCWLVSAYSLNLLDGWSRESTLIYIVAMASSKNWEVKNCWGIEEQSVSGDCKDDFMNK